MTVKKPGATSKSGKKTNKKKTTEPTKQQKKNRFFVGLLTISLIIGGFVALLITLNEPISDAQLVRNAIENSMSKETARLTYEYGDDNYGIVMVYDVDYTDVTNVVAKGRITSDSGHEFGSTADGSYDVVAGLDGISYARATRFDHDEPPENGAVVGEWYSLDIADIRENVDIYASRAGDDVFASTMLSILISAEGVATAQGEIPDGNFLEEDREKILAIVEGQDTFFVTASQEVEMDGRTLRRLELIMRHEVLNNMNREVAEILDEEPLLRLAQDREVVAYIDTETQRFYRVSFAGGTQSVTITNVNDPVEVMAPKNTTDIVGYLRDL